jgi:hypothetical protein
MRQPEQLQWQPPSRNTITSTVIRTARDSGWQLDHIFLCQFVANLLRIHPFEVLIAVGSLDTLKDIASGSHPACKSNIKSTQSK